MDGEVMLIDKSRAPALPDSAKARRGIKNGATTQKIEEVAQDFEAVFLTQMLEHMFTGVGEDNPFRSKGDDIYRSMMLEEYGKMITKTGGIGVADHVKRELLRTQEINNDTGQYRNIPRPDRSN